MASAVSCSNSFTKPRAESDSPELAATAAAAVSADKWIGTDSTSRARGSSSSISACAASTSPRADRIMAASGDAISPIKVCPCPRSHSAVSSVMRSTSSHSPKSYSASARLPLYQRLGRPRPRRRASSAAERRASAAAAGPAPNKSSPRARLFNVIVTACVPYARSGSMASLASTRRSCTALRSPSQQRQAAEFDRVRRASSSRLNRWRSGSAFSHHSNDSRL